VAQPPLVVIEREIIMSETVRFFLLQLSLISVVLILHTYLGLHIIRRVLVFSDLALDQLAALGAIVGTMLNIEYGTPFSYVISLGAVLIGALLLAVIKPKNLAIPREAVIGIIYALTMIACLMLTDRLPQGDALLTKTLSGYMAWVNWNLVAVTAAVYILLMLFHYRFRKQFISLAEDPGGMQNTALWDFLFFATQGIITVLIVPIAGVFLAYVFLMIPAAIAAMFTRKWILGVLLGWGIGMLACTLGLTASFYYDWPYSPTLVLALGAFFLGAVVFRCVLPNKNHSLTENSTLWQKL
jgi:zinc/manganese transport system permease protein